MSILPILNITGYNTILDITTQLNINPLRNKFDLLGEKAKGYTDILFVSFIFGTRTIGRSLYRVKFSCEKVTSKLFLTFTELVHQIICQLR